jgi:hypothetical protein
VITNGGMGADMNGTSKDSFVGKYFIAWHGRRRHDLGFPVIQSYGLVSGKVREGLYSVEAYELGSPEARNDTMTGQRLAACRLFDEWRQMKTWISDVYMPCIRVEVFGGVGSRASATRCDRIHDGDALAASLGEDDPSNSCTRETNTDRPADRSRKHDG